MREPEKRRLLRQTAWLLAAAAFFVLLNGGIYAVLTRRLGNNYSGTRQIKMIDVGAYLPHADKPALSRVDASLVLEGELPVLDGAAALVPVYASVIENLYPAGAVTYQGGSFSDDNQYGENFAADSKMQYQNTVRGFRAVVNGETDLFFSAAPSREQWEYAAEQGVELVCIPIGLEAFVFFVNARNPVDGLSTEQIRGIYAGEYRDWSQLGGAKRPICPMTRVAGSGSQTVMELFMDGREIAPKPPFAIFGGAIGYSFRFFLQEMAGSGQVKMLAVDGVYPDPAAIRDGSYPLVYPFYVIYRADNAKPAVRQLVDWLLSPEGQQMIEGCGYVGLPQE